MTSLVNAINHFRQSEGDDLVDGRSLFNTVSKFSVNGQMIHSRTGRKSRRNSYTVEFHDGDSVSFCYVDIVVHCRAKCYAIIQTLETGEWSVCVPQQKDLSDIVSTYGD